MSFPYINSVSAQRWYRINVKDYSISAQRWYRIELKVLIIDFSNKEFYVVLEGQKTMNWVLVTQKERRSLHKRHFSKWALITLSAFRGAISMSTFLFKPFFKENTLSHAMVFFLFESQVISSFSFIPSRRTTRKTLSEKTIIKTLSSILYHRWAEIESNIFLLH